MGNQNSKTGVTGRRKTKIKVEEFHPDGNGHYCKTVKEKQIPKSPDKLYSRQNSTDTHKKNTDYSNFSVENTKGNPHSDITGRKIDNKLGIYNINSTKYSSENTRLDAAPSQIKGDSSRQSMTPENTWISPEVPLSNENMSGANGTHKKKQKLSGKVSSLLGSHAHKTKVAPSDLEGSASQKKPEIENLLVDSPTEETGFSGNYGFAQPVSRHTEELDDGFISVCELFNQMNDGQLSPYLFDPSYMLIVDCRQIEHYKNKHIVTAVHYSDVEEFRSEKELGDYDLIILYDETGHSSSLSDSVLTKAFDKLKVANINTTVILQDGFKAMLQKHPYLCTATTLVSEAERQALLTIYPSIILENQLYLGNAEQATNKDIIQDLQISHIVNISCEVENVFQHTVKYFNIMLEDVTTSNLLQHFPEAIRFIDAALEKDGRVLVHCNLGVSRSATITIAYLMHSRQWTLKDAYNFVKNKRPVTQPNRGFFQQLSKYEEQMYGEKITTVNTLWQ